MDLLVVAVTVHASPVTRCVLAVFLALEVWLIVRSTPFLLHLP